MFAGSDGYDVHAVIEEQVGEGRSGPAAASAGLTRRPECTVVDGFHNGQPGHGATVSTLEWVDDYTRQCLRVEVYTSLSGERVARVLEEPCWQRGGPPVIVVDHGPEFNRQALDRGACRREVRLHFIGPGKPEQNADVESFNGEFRDECLKEHWFADLKEAREEIEDWRQDYNQRRPHRALR